MGVPSGPDPGEIRRCVLRDGEVSVAILNLGCITQDWRVPSRNGPVSVVLGYRDPTAYLKNPAYLGAIVGRVANRVAHARFARDGTEYRLAANDGNHMLHGGAGGISTRIWEMEPDGDRAVQLRLTSPAGDQGFPGRADMTVTITLKGHTLAYDMRAAVDRPTPISLAQHNYYRLTGVGAGGVRDHELRLHASAYTPNGAASIPLGTRDPVRGTRFDFTRARSFADADPESRGYDINYALDRSKPAAELAGLSGIRLRLDTDQPGLQLYTGRYLEPVHEPLAGQTHGPYAGVCLEAQGFPNAVNTPGFPSVTVTPDAPYSQRLSVTISEKGHH